MECFASFNAKVLNLSRETKIEFRIIAILTDQMVVIESAKNNMIHKLYRVQNLAKILINDIWRGIWLNACPSTKSLIMQVL